MNNQELLQAGTLLYNGKYRIEGVIEQGGLGITYKANLVQLDIVVTVKEMFLAGKCIREEDNSISLKSFSEKRFKAFKDNFIVGFNNAYEFDFNSMRMKFFRIEPINTVLRVIKGPNSYILLSQVYEADQNKKSSSIVIYDKSDFRDKFLIIVLRSLCFFL